MKFVALNRERLRRLGLRHDVGPQPPVGPVIEIEELRGTSVIEPDFIVATASNGLLLSEVYVGHAVDDAVSRRQEKGMLVIPVHDQCRCIGCNPGKRPDTRMVKFASEMCSRDIARDRFLCISV
jgi:hypothetical protein